MIRAYYNEYDKEAAAWLRELIRRGLITLGDVDERDIRDVRPSDLRGYDRVHFFAGLGGWDYALNRADWPVHRPVWTGSCPCPPFSAAGKGQRCPSCGSARNICHPRKTGHFVCLDCGCDRHADERHLWPEFARLIRECDAPTSFGEQVASADGRLWLGAVRADVETMGRSLGGADLCAAGIGSPHIRQRLWFVTESVADTLPTGRTEGRSLSGDGSFTSSSSSSSIVGMAEPNCRQRNGLPNGEGRELDGQAAGRKQGNSQFECGEQSGRLDDDDDDERREGQWDARLQRQQLHDADGRSQDGRDGRRAGPTNGFWRDADWLFCRDGKWRPVESRLKPLVDGAPARVGRLRGYGNAIVAQVAEIFIRAYLERETVELEPIRTLVAGSPTLSFEDLLG